MDYGGPSLQHSGSAGEPDLSLLHTRSCGCILSETLD